MAYKLNKKFPLNFSKDIEKVVNILSVKHGEKAGLYGSARFKIDTSGDFDFFQEVKLTPTLLEGDNILHDFQEVVRNILKTKGIFLGDIKSGEIPALRVVDFDINENNYMKKRPAMIKKLKQLLTAGNIDKEEFDESIALLKPNLTEMDLSIVRDAIRFEVIRWSPEDILQGHTTYRKKKINFKDFVFTFSTTKIDILAWVNGIRYTEITMVYFFTDEKGEQINSGFQYLKEFLSDSIPILLKKGNYMKICKKINAIERTKEEPNTLILKRMYRLYTSNLGRLSQIVSDIKVLIYLVENVKAIPKDKFKYEIDQMKYRLGVISNEKYLKHQEQIVKLINEIEKDVVDLKLLDNLKDEINDILQSETLKQMKKWKLFPIPNEYLPKPDDVRGQGVIDTIVKGVNYVSNLFPASDKNATKIEAGEKHGVLILPNGKIGRSNYMGPGTNLMKRLKRGDKPRTEMDELSRAHDIRYDLAKSQKDIAEADKIFIKGAKKIRKEKKDNVFNTYAGQVPIQAKYFAEKHGLIKPSFEKIQTFDKEEEELLHKTLASAIQKGYGECHMVKHILKGIPKRFIPDDIKGSGDKTIALKKKNLLKEHMRLIDILKHGTREEQIKEAEDQQKEMQQYKGGLIEMTI